MVEFPHVFEETTLYVNSDTVIAVMLCITALAMMLAFHIILSVVLGGGTNGMLTAEPVCSRFGYEEKILAKTIRLDVSVQDLIKSVTNVQTASEALNIKLKEFEARLDVLESMKHDTKETVDHQQKKCPSTYKHRSDLNLCWKYQKGVKLNSFEAEDRCSKEGAHLMILNTTHIVKFMQEWLKTAGVEDASVIVGGNDIMEEGSFKWNNGENVQQIPWGKGEPNGGKNSNCLVMERSYAFAFCDRECSDQREFLCQITL